MQHIWSMCENICKNKKMRMNVPNKYDTSFFAWMEIGNERKFWSFADEFFAKLMTFQ